MTPTFTLRAAPWLRCLCLAAVLVATLRAAAPRRFDIPAGAAEATLKTYRTQSGAEVVYAAEAVRGVRTNAVRGELSPRAALEALVAGTPLALGESPGGALALSRPPDPNAQRAAPVSPAGAVEGRVFDEAAGTYVYNARVSIAALNLEAFTDESGSYRLLGVPAGAVTLGVFHTGGRGQSAVVTVLPAETARRDFTLNAADRAAGAVGAPLKLEQFVVSSSKQMSGAAIAINEQRFAANIKNVVSTDEFGDLPHGNVGEFMKFLPGVTLEYVGGNARTISLNGVPSGYVPVTIGGFSLASAATGTDRTVELNQVSINNIARIEVSFSPTPEVAGAALAGTVNLVPRSAFERSRPVFNGSAYLALRDDARSLGRTPGPHDEPTRKIRPGFDFSYVAPVNANFGYTLSGSASQIYLGQPAAQNTWRGGGAATNGTTLPDTTPDRPYLTDYLARVSHAIVTRTSLGATADWRLGRHDRLSFGFQYATFDSDFESHNLAFLVNRVLPGDFTTTSTRGFVGAGEIRLTNGVNQRSGATYMPSLVYRHTGPLWSLEAGTGLSRATNRFHNVDKGRFNTSLVRRTGVTVSFDEITNLRPGRITVTDGATGAPVDPFDIDSYAVGTAGGSLQRAVNVQRSAYGHARRELVVREVPVTLKAGFDVRQDERDIRGSQTALTFVGADGRASTTPAVPGGSDDGAARFLEPSSLQQAGPFGFPRLPWISNEKLWDYYRTNPQSFTLNQDAQYRSEVNLSKHTEETVSAAYLRGDVALLNRRVRLVGGLRAEQTNVRAEGPLTDQTRNFQRDSSGRVLLGANGQPLLRTTVPLEVTRLTLVDRGQASRKEYLRWFPSLNASWNLRENLIARAAWYRSIGRPDFNQYAGGLTLPNTEAAPSFGNRITVNNAGIKPWSAESFKVRLEYYFEPASQVSLGAFRRDFTNFFATTVLPATPEFLALYGLDPAVYAPYDVATQFNLDGTVRMEGLEFDYKQALVFLPAWARGLRVFANASAQRATGAASDNFANYVPRTVNWGLSLARETYSLKANWSYRSRARRAAVAPGRGIAPATYNWGRQRLYLDLSGEYQIRRGLALFCNLQNLLSTPDDFEVANPSTPEPARLTLRTVQSSLWTIGVKGTF